MLVKIGNIYVNPKHVTDVAQVGTVVKLYTLACSDGAYYTIQDACAETIVQQLNQSERDSEYHDTIQDLHNTLLRLEGLLLHQQRA